MKKSKVIILIILIVFNIIVIMGQILPDDAPPFAGVVNMIFLISSFFYFTVSIMRTVEKK
jgi:hypothetical protein